MVKQVAIQIIIVSAMMWLAKGAMYESYYIRTSDFMMEEVNGYPITKEKKSINFGTLRLPGLWRYRPETFARWSASV